MQEKARRRQQRWQMINKKIKPGRTPGFEEEIETSLASFHPELG